MPLPPLTLYTRTGCHLCEMAEAELNKLEFRYSVVNIAGQPDLEALYGQDIPVLATGDKVLLKGVLSKGRLSNLKLRLLIPNAVDKDSG